MNEKDIMHNIENKTKDIPIPDSISPEAMQKMLDSHINETGLSAKNGAGRDKSSHTGIHGRNTRRIAVCICACIALCLAGGMGFFTLRQSDNKSGTYNEGATATSNDEAAEEYVEGNDDTSDNFDSDLAYQSGLISPDSYDDYYETLKSAYDDYYDRIASVQTKYDVTEAEMEEAAMEDSAAKDMGAATGGAATNSADVLRSDKQKADYSTTNTQEQSVDEGDVIKTDGTYIYKVTHSFNNRTGDYETRLIITKTDKGNLTYITSINLNSVLDNSEKDYVNFEEFYLYNDRLVFLYTQNRYADDMNNTDSTKTYIVIYDIKDKENPKEVKHLSQSGWFVSSRISDGYLYTISNFNDTSLESKKPYTNYIPTINDKTIDCKNIYYPRNVLMETTYVMTSLDLSKPTDFADTKAIPTRAGQTYVSDSSIYIFTTLYDSVTKTEITKVGYDKGKLTPGSSATVAGYLYGSFALSEYNGYLRIVATIPANNISLLRGFTIEETMDSSQSTAEVIPEDVNALYILDSNMNLTGKLSGLAPGEQIYSARFMGDIGYFVTFRNTDPLFSVDLSDTYNPQILGKLKIPGFSEYLHFYGDGLLLGIGEERDETTSEFKGLKLSMFDINNPADVTEQDKYIIEKSSYSEALYNHKAIMINSEKNIFGFLYCCMDSNYNDIYYYSTYSYDKEKGFVETARYRINDGSEYEYDAVRGVYIGDYLYLATNRSITSYKLGSADAIAQINLDNIETN
ncbi:MAG: beta-propeller domain-containing protein [Lachnospiraceae bacterium]|nr:beta-propeller domain-containing protein [Lachnospiraceae bacterium]